MRDDLCHDSLHEEALAIRSGLCLLLSSEDRLEITRALAGMLVEAQSLTWEYAGKDDVESNAVTPFETNYREWIVQGVREQVSASQSYNDHTTPSDVEWIEGIIDQVKPALPLAYSPCIVLGDYGEHNVLAMNSGGKWRISAIFDLMTAHFGEGQADLSLQVKGYLDWNEQLADAFVAEYLRLKPRQPGFVEHQQLYMLDLTLSFWRYWQRHQGAIPGQKESLSFEEWARPAVEYWDKYRT